MKAVLIIEWIENSIYISLYTETHAKKDHSFSGPRDEH